MSHTVIWVVISGPWARSVAMVNRPLSCHSSNLSKCSHMHPAIVEKSESSGQCWRAKHLSVREQGTNMFCQKLPADVMGVPPCGVLTYSWRDEKNEVLKSLYERDKPLHEGLGVCFPVWVPPNGQHLSVWERTKSWWRLLTIFPGWFIQELERQAVFVINERREGARWQPDSPS